MSGVYLNGQIAFACTRSERGFDDNDLLRKAPQALRSGTNVMAVHAEAGGKPALRPTVRRGVENTASASDRVRIFEPPLRSGWRVQWVANECRANRRFP